MHLTLLIHLLICQLFCQWFLLLVLPTGLLQHLNRPLLLFSPLGISQSVPVTLTITLTITLNLQWLLTMYALGTQNGKHLHLVEYINQNLLLLATM